MIQVKQSWLDPSVLGSCEPFNCTYELKTHNNKYVRHTVYFKGFKFPTMTTAPYHESFKTKETNPVPTLWMFPATVPQRHSETEPRPPYCQSATCQSGSPPEASWNILTLYGMLESSTISLTLSPAWFPSKDYVTTNAGHSPTTCAWVSACQHDPHNISLAFWDPIPAKEYNNNIWRRNRKKNKKLQDTVLVPVYL